MKKVHLRLLVSITVFAFFTWVFLSTASRPRILVLFPLNPTADWSIRVEKGIKQGLVNNRRPVAMSYHYMDMNNEYSEHQLHVAVASAVRAIEREKPSILISVDDETNSLVTSKLEPSLRPPVIFTAMLQSPASYGYSSEARVSGVIEGLPTAAIVEIMNVLKLKESLKVAAIGINDVTGQSEMKIIQTADWGPHTLGPVSLVDDFKEWQAFIKGPASQADILIVLTTDLLKKERGGDYVPEEEIVAWTQANASPLSIGVRLSYVRYGGGLAVAMPGEVFGRQAMEMSLKWLDSGLNGPPPPVEKPNDFDMAIRTSVLRERGILLPNVYRELARSSGNLFP